MMPLLCFVAGCNQRMEADYDSLQLATVRGTVTLDGDPLPEATVMLCNQTGQQFSSGVTNAQGQFEMWYNTEARGVTPGEKIVRIRMGPVGEGGAGEEEDGERANPTSKLPEIYHAKSQKTVTIDANGEHTFEFHLKSQPDQNASW